MRPIYAVCTLLTAAMLIWIVVLAVQLFGQVDSTGYWISLSLLLLIFGGLFAGFLLRYLESAPNNFPPDHSN